MTVRVVTDQGQGRTFVFLVEAGQYHQFATQAALVLGGRVRALTIECPTITELNWAQFSEQVLVILQDLKVRQCAFIGFGAAGALVQHIVLVMPRLIRSITIVDATFRPHPGWFQRIVDWCERIMPLGLPLRLREYGFDSKPFAQRIRCPALIVLTKHASLFVRDQAYAIAQRIPSAWVVSLINDGSDVDEFCALVDEFEGVPVKCPQKNRSDASQMLGQV